MNYSYIILNEALAIKNARGETVYLFHAGERVKVEATAEYYWMTKYGAVWFSQAKLEGQSHVETAVVMLHMFDLFDNLTRQRGY